MNISYIKAAIQSIVETQLSVTTIHANQNAPIPEKPFITLLLTVTEKIGHDEPVQTSDTEQTITGQREFEVNFQAFGDTAYQLMLDLQDAFEADTIRADLAAAGIVYVSNESVTNADTILDTKIEHRASMVVLFRTDSTKLYTNTIIEQVDVTQTVYNPDGTIADNSNYLIN